MAMARVSSGLAYPERFFAAASYTGLDGSPANTLTSKFPNDVALLLHALYHQATIGPCKIPKPRSWSPVEQGKWTSWNRLGNMASTEAMRLFIKILEEEDPGWYSRASSSILEPVQDVVTNHILKDEGVIENGHTLPEIEIISTEFENVIETQDKDVVMEGMSSVGVYDQWVASPVSGPRPKTRYKHGAAIVDDKMYIFGGNHNGRYLNDLQALDLRNRTWSKVVAKTGSDALESPSPVTVSPCAGHSLIPWGGNKLLSVAGHAKDPCEFMQVKVFDLQTCSWSALKTYGKPPVSRGGQSVTLVGTSLVIFGGEDSRRSPLNDLHILDLETLTWDEIDTLGVPPSPRSDHAAAVHVESYLLIFGGGSHAACFNDLHVLDLQTMEWSKPIQQGEIPNPRAGPASATLGESWFIAGGGDNKSGVSETVVLNMSTLAWSVVTTVQGGVPLASEGLSLVLGSCDGEDILVSFGGYNGKYNSEVHILKPSHKSTLQSKTMMGTPVPDSVSAVQNATNGTRDVESEFEAREIVMDSVDLAPKIKKIEETNEHLIAVMKAEKEELELSSSKEKVLLLQLKQELKEAKSYNTDLYTELQSVRSQLASEHSRCFKLEVEVAELRQKLQTMDTLKKELELLQRQKATSEEVGLNAKHRQGSGGVWGWLAGTPGQTTDGV